jgi:hypothetical protein
MCMKDADMFDDLYKPTMLICTYQVLKHGVLHSGRSHSGRKI